MIETPPKTLNNMTFFQQFEKETQSAKPDSKSTTSVGSSTSQRRLNGEKIELEVSFLKSLVEETHKRVSSDLAFITKNAAAIEKLNTTKNISDSELRMIKVLMNFNAYTLQNRLTEPTFHKPDQIISRFKTMKIALEMMADCLKHHLLTTPISFSDEKECFRSFQAVFQDKLFQQPYFRRICSEIYRSTVDEKIKKPSEVFYQRFYESIKLFLFGISLPSDNPADYPLHNAIYNSDIEQVRRLCEGTQTDCFYVHVEQADPMDLSALTLAIKLGRPEIVKVLVENGADPQHRVTPKGKFPMEEAMTLKNKEIIRTLLLAGHQLKLNRWEKTKQEVLNLLESIPDFSFEIHWECDSNYIPFVSKLAPSDTNKISKKGSSLRMDATIAGINKLKVIRGNISLFLLGKDHPGSEGQLLMVNHDKKTVTNLMTDIDLKRLDKQVDYIAKQNSLPNEIKPEDVQFEPAKTWRGEPVTEKIQNCHTVKYNAKGTISLLYTKKINEDVSKFSTFEKYFESCFPTRFWAPTSSDDVSPFDQLLSYANADPRLSKKLFDELKEENKKHELVSKFENMKNPQNKQSKETKKHIDASIWLTDNFPLHFQHLIAILDVLSSANPNISKLKEFLDKKSILNNGSFPLKAIVPLYLSVSAVINFRNFVFKTPDSALFEVPKNTELTTNPQIMRISVSSKKTRTPDEVFTTSKNSEKIQNEPQSFDSKKPTSIENIDKGLDCIETEDISSRVLSELTFNENQDQLKDAPASLVSLSFKMERYSLHSRKRSNGQSFLSGRKGHFGFYSARECSVKVRSEPSSCTKEYRYKNDGFASNFSKFCPHDSLETNSPYQLTHASSLDKRTTENLFATYGIDDDSIPTEYSSEGSENLSIKFAIPTSRARKENPSISLRKVSNN